MISSNCKENSEINVYPNPFDNKINIDFDDVTHFPIDITIFSAVGQLVYQKTIADKQSKTSLDLELIPGNYILNIKSSNFNINKRITKMK